MAWGSGHPHGARDASITYLTQLTLWLLPAWDLRISLSNLNVSASRTPQGGTPLPDRGGRKGDVCTRKRSYRAPTGNQWCHQQSVTDLLTWAARTKTWASANTPGWRTQAEGGGKGWGRRRTAQWIGYKTRVPEMLGCYHLGLARSRLGVYSLRR